MVIRTKVRMTTMSTSPQEVYELSPQNLCIWHLIGKRNSAETIKLRIQAGEGTLIVCGRPMPSRCRGRVTGRRREV